MEDLFAKKGNVLGNDIEPTNHFGGKNKARRLAKAIKKGKTAKAEKLAKKVIAKVQKLEEKGKTSKKRYEFMMKRLKEAGEENMTIQELTEIEGIANEATMDDEAGFESELKDAEADTPDGTSATGDDGTATATRWIKFMPNWATITIPSVLIVGIIGAIMLSKRGKK